MRIAALVQVILWETLRAVLGTELRQEVLAVRFGRGLRGYFLRMCWQQPLASALLGGLIQLLLKQAADAYYAFAKPQLGAARRRRGDKKQCD